MTSDLARGDASSPSGAAARPLTPDLFRDALEASSIGMALSDLGQPDQPLVYINPAFERLTGYTAAEVLGRNCRLLQGALRDQPAVLMIREAITARRALTVRLKNYRKDGSLFWNELTLSPLYGANGEPSHYVGFQNDVTAEQSALAALAHSEAQARMLLASTPAAIVAADLESHQVVFANRAFEVLTGRTAGELIGRDPMQLHPPESRPMVAQSFAAFVRGERDLEADVPLLHASGRVFPVEIRAVHGELDGRDTIFAVFTDQSARRAAQREAASQLARLQAIVQAHPDVVLMLDADGMVVETLRNVSTAPLPLCAGGCRRLGEGLPAAVDARLQRLLQQVLVSGVAASVEFSPDDGDSSCELRLVPLPDGQLLALIRDVSEARRAAAALLASESDYRNLFETMAQGVVYQLADGRITRVNPAACRLLGLTEDQLLGRDSQDPRWHAIHADGSPFPGAEHPAMVSLATGQPVNNETIGVFHPERREYVWLLVSAIPEFRVGEQRPWRVYTTLTDISALRQTTEALAQSQQLFEDAGRLARIGTWSHDVATGLTEWSAVTCEIHEVDVDHVPQLADALRFYAEGESRERITRAFGQALHNGQVYDEELQIETAAGNRRWVRTIGRGVFEQGRCVRVYGTFQDITDQQRAMQELTRQSELQQLLMDIAATYINLPFEHLDETIAVSLAQLGAFANADRFYVFDYDFESMRTSNTHEWCAPGVPPQRALLQNYPLSQMETWLQLHQRGESMHVEDVLSLPPDDALRRALEPQGVRSMMSMPLMLDGSCLGFVGMDYLRGPHVVSETETKLLTVFAQMLVNVRVRQSMLRELTENRNFLAEVIENSGSMIFIKDLQGHYLSVNQQWEAIYCLKREAVLGRRDEELFSPTLAAALSALDHGAIQFGLLRQSEEQLETPSGLRHFYTVRFPVRDHDGVIYGIAGMATDITEHQRLEEERRARDLAETANREKNAFLAKMSHEIRTPLNAIIGFSRRLMVDESLRPKPLEQIRTVHRSATHLLGMLNDLLDYARLDSGRHDAQELEFDLRALLDDLAAMFRFRCEEKQLKFVFRWDSELPRRACGDAGKLRQILMNLLGNAVKFTSSGQVTLRAHRDGAVVEGGFMLEIEVEDTGAGIPAEELPHLFEEFWQGRSGLAIGGTGLGLPITQSLLKLLGGGPVDVSSEADRGSCFRFRLPLRLGTPMARDHLSAQPVVDNASSLPEATSVPDEAEIARQLAELSSDRLEQLRDSLSRGEMSVFRELVSGAPGVPAPISELLLGLASQYNYARLSRLLGQIDPHDGGSA